MSAVEWVAAAIHATLCAPGEWGVSCDLLSDGSPNKAMRHHIDTCHEQAQSGIAAHTAWLLEQGRVTDDDIEAAAEGTVERSVIAVRDLIARAVATATAEKDTEVERLRQENAATYKSLLTACQDANAEIERLRATIARVEALCDDVIDGSGLITLVRAALADENGDTA